MISAAILAVIAIAFLTVGIVFCIVPAGSLPGWLGHATVIAHGQRLPSPGHHPLRAVGSLIAGVVFGIGAWFSFRYKGPAAGAATAAEKETGTTATPTR